MEMLLLTSTICSFLLLRLRYSLRLSKQHANRAVQLNLTMQTSRNVENSAYLRLMALRTALVSSRSCEAGVHAAQLATE